MPEIATKGKARGTANRDDGGSGPSLPPLRVRYFRRMKLQRVYAVEVAWQKAERPVRGAGKEVTVRLLGAGAQILPTEQTMDAAKPDVKAVFYVTPLAKGWLRNLNLEVLAQGRKIQEIPLASKVVSQRVTWALLILAFLLPWLIVEEVRNTSLGDPNPGVRITYPKISKQVEDYIKENVPSVPDFLKGTAVEKGLLDARSSAVHAYQHVVLISRIEPIAFYVGAAFFCFALISAYLHKQKRGKATGKPLPVAAVVKSAPAEDEE